MAAHSEATVDINLESPPTSIANNLTCNGSSLVYVAKNNVLLVDDDEFLTSSCPKQRTSAYNKASCVNSATWVPTPSGSLMVVMTSDRDIFFYSDQAGEKVTMKQQQRLLYSLSLKSNGGNSLREDDGATCAASVLCVDDSCQICIGCNNGEILVISCERNLSSFALEKTLKEHESPLSDLASDYDSSRGTRCTMSVPGTPGATNNRCEMVSVDVDGQLCLWTALSGKKFGLKCKHFISSCEESLQNSYGSACCVCACVRGPWIMCGMANGEVICFIHDDNDSNSLRPYWCVVAHSRFLSCMDLHPIQNVLVTAAEDGTVCVWQLHIPELDHEDNKAFNINNHRVVDVLHSSIWENVMIVGVAFCGSICDKFAIIGYDKKSMRVCSWG